MSSIDSIYWSKKIILTCIRAKLDKIKFDIYRPKVDIRILSNSNLETTFNLKFEFQIFGQILSYFLSRIQNSSDLTSPVKQWKTGKTRSTIIMRVI